VASSPVPVTSRGPARPLLPWFLAASVVGLLTSPFTAVWTLVLALPVALAALAIAVRRPHGPAPLIAAVAAGLFLGASVYVVAGLIISG
jgi:hypothetical protein